MTQPSGPQEVIVYECGICNGIHYWDFDGDCREEGCQVRDDDPGILIMEVRSMGERVATDEGLDWGSPEFLTRAAELDHARDLAYEDAIIDEEPEGGES